MMPLSVVMPSPLGVVSVCRVWFVSLTLLSSATWLLWGRLLSLISFVRCGISISYGKCVLLTSSMCDNGRLFIGCALVVRCGLSVKLFGLVTFDYL